MYGFLNCTVLLTHERRSRIQLILYLWIWNVIHKSDGIFTHVEFQSQIWHDISESQSQSWQNISSLEFHSQKRLNIPNLELFSITWHDIEICIYIHRGGRTFQIWNPVLWRLTWQCSITPNFGERLAPTDRQRHWARCRHLLSAINLP